MSNVKQLPLLSALCFLTKASKRPLRYQIAKRFLLLCWLPQYRVLCFEVSESLQLEQNTVKNHREFQLFNEIKLSGNFKIIHFQDCVLLDSTNIGGFSPSFMHRSFVIIQVKLLRSALFIVLRSALAKTNLFGMRKTKLWMIQRLFLSNTFCFLHIDTMHMNSKPYSMRNGTGIYISI